MVYKVSNHDEVASLNVSEIYEALRERFPNSRIVVTSNTFVPEIIQIFRIERVVATIKRLASGKTTIQSDNTSTLIIDPGFTVENLVERIGDDVVIYDREFHVTNYIESTMECLTDANAEVYRYVDLVAREKIAKSLRGEPFNEREFATVLAAFIKKDNLENVVPATEWFELVEQNESLEQELMGKYLENPDENIVLFLEENVRAKFEEEKHKAFDEILTQLPKVKGDKLFRWKY